LRNHADAGAGRLLERFEHFMPLVEQGITQAARRLLQGEQVPATEKLLSLFEEHTQIITRQKMGKPREFGRKVLIEEVDGGIISRYEILSESASERSNLPESLRGPISSTSVGRLSSWLATEASIRPRTRKPLGRRV
jgi:hypothetical protein